MKFNTSIAKELTKNDELKYFTAGIMEDVILKSVEIKETPTGAKYISFIFSKEGYKDWEYSQYVPTKWDSEPDDTNMINKMNNQIGRFDKILRCYYAEEKDRLYETEDYLDYLNWLKDMLNTANKTDILLRVKLIYDEKGYLTFPRYLKFDFIERMDTEKRKVEILSFDKITKPEIVADKETTETNEAVSSTPVSDNSDSDMPF